MEQEAGLMYLLGTGVMAIGGAIIKGLCDRALRQMDETIKEQGKAIHQLQIALTRAQGVTDDIKEDVDEIKGDIKLLLRRGGK